MFKKKKKYLYQQILASDERACQIRTFDGKILYTNSRGGRFFGFQDDPFALFNQNDQSVKELYDAYHHHLPFHNDSDNSIR